MSAIFSTNKGIESSTNLTIDISTLESWPLNKKAFTKLPKISSRINCTFSKTEWLKFLTTSKIEKTARKTNEKYR